MLLSLLSRLLILTSSNKLGSSVRDCIRQVGHEHSYTNNSHHPNTGHAKAWPSTELWPNCRVQYVIKTVDNCNHAEFTSTQNCDGQEFSASDGLLASEHVAAAAQHISNMTLCSVNEVTLTTSSTWVNQNLLHIHDDVSNPPGCWASLGYNSQGDTEIGLGWCKDDIGTITHELLHSFGMVHEQQRPDRTTYLNLGSLGNIDGNCYIFNWASSPLPSEPYTEMDLTSIMLYFATAQNCWTSLTTEGEALRQCQNIATADIGNKMYGDDGRMSALDIIGLHSLYGLASYTETQRHPCNVSVGDTPNPTASPTVPPNQPENNDNKLSPGAVAGIVVGCTSVVAAGTYYIYQGGSSTYPSVTGMQSDSAYI